MHEQQRISMKKKVSTVEGRRYFFIKYCEELKLAKQKCRVHIVQSWAVFVYACSARTQVSFSSVLHTDRRPITINKSESPPL